MVDAQYTSARLPITDRLDDVAVINAVLGFTFATALATAVFVDFKSLPIYISALALFHFLEFYTTARYNPRRVTVDSFLLRNGSEYYAAQVCSLLEYLIKFYLFPGFQGSHSVISALGLSIALFGQVCRSIAMAHAANNFNHIVQHRRNNDHQLVTTGIYSFIRHPSYFGFFYWSLGLQIFLLNPISFCGFALVLWRFFSDRIIDEEESLVTFFGEKYVQYRLLVPTRIPFIR